MTPTKDRPKKQIHKKIEEYVDRYDFEGTVDSVIEKLQKWKEKYGPDTRIDWDTDYEGSDVVNVYIDREETDAEYVDRITRENIQRMQQEAREKAEYERLKKKFG